MSVGLSPGTIFAARYEVLRCIATGGMGAVYEVRHIETARRRALKVMNPSMVQSAELRDRFKREARIAADVESEFIVEVFDAGFDEATSMPFLVMELLKGEDLGKRLKRIGRFSQMEVVTYLKQAALALDKTHKAAIVHRDLKPDNLFLTLREDGQPRIKVLDFGVAKVIAESGIAAGETRSLGTPLYMAPEQYDPEAKLTGAADIYALGMIAYTLLVGAPYWGAESRSGNVVAFATIAAKGPVDPASERSARAGVPLPPAFDAWFARMTAVDPAQRYPVATAAIAALTEALRLTIPLPSFSIEPDSVAAGELPTTVFQPKPKPQPSQSRGPILGAAIVLGLAALGGGAFALSHASKDAPDAPTTTDSAAPPAASATASITTPSSEPTASAASAASAPLASASASAPATSASVATAPSGPALPASARPGGARPVGSTQKKGLHPEWGQQ